MANRYKAAENRPRVAPGGNKPVPPVEETPVVEPVIAPETTQVESESVQVVGTDFLAGKIEPKQEGKTVGFYLSNEANKKLERLAKQLKCSKSKALDTLIRNVLE